jgi:type II secretory pathway pseudopilin PulG
VETHVRGAAGGIGPAGDRCAHARSFTLIEMMIVLVLMLSVMAIALPLTLQDARRAAYREAQEQCSAVLMSARADAQRTARTVRVLALRRSGEDLWVLRTEEVADASGLAAEPDSGANGVKFMQETALPAGVSMSRSEDEAWGLAAAGDDADEAEGDGMPGQDAGAAASEGAGVSMGVQDAGAWMRVAVFLPDGQIAASSGLFVRVSGAAGEVLRVGRLTLNTWTGVVALADVPKPRQGDELDGAGSAGSGEVPP